MKRKGVLLFLFCFLGILGCVEYEEKIEVKSEGRVKLTASVVVNLEEFVKVMEEFSGKEMKKEEVLREIEKSREEVKKK